MIANIINNNRSTPKGKNENSSTSLDIYINYVNAMDDTQIYEIYEDGE